MLGHLYDELDCSPGLKGPRVGNAEEFMAYRVLQSAAKGSEVLAMEVASIPRRYLRHEFVTHAVAAAKALVNGNYHR